MTRLGSSEAPPGTHRPKRKTMAATLLAVAALAVAGCGGGGSKGSSGSTSQGTTNADSAQQSGIAYAQCMRAHGVSNYPDNAVTNTGNGTKVNLPQGITNNPDYGSASQACQSKLPGGGSGGGSSGNTQAELKLANCMRSHGVTNFPEPDSQGHIVMGGSSGIDTNSPTYQSAWQACRSQLPNSGAGLGG